MEMEDMTNAYELASAQDWKGFKRFYEENAAKKPLLTALNVDGDNAFHIAAGSGNVKLLRDLLAMQPPDQRHEALKSSDFYGHTPLHDAAMSECVAAAKLLIDAAGSGGMLRRKNEILQSRNKIGETALYKAATAGNTSMVQYLIKEIEDLGKSVFHLEEDELLGHLRSYHFRRDIDNISILHIAVLGRHFDTAIWLLRKDEELANKREDNNATCLQLLALMTDTFLSTCWLSKFQRVVYFCLPNLSNDDDEIITSNQTQDLEIGMSYCDSRLKRKKQNAIAKMWTAACRRLIKGWPTIDIIWKEKQMHKSAVKLVEELVKKDHSWKQRHEREGNVEMISLGRGKARASPDTASKGVVQIPLIIAASTGIIEIFDAITKQFPQAVHYATAEGQNILHVAIKCRQETIFNRIKAMDKQTVAKLAGKIDNNGNTIQHQVADMSCYREGKRPGPALQFQEELEWSTHVEKLAPRHYGLHRNKQGITAREFHDKTHEKQCKEAEEWLKNTSESCSLLAILVATVVFAAAYTVPGGVNAENGRPVLLNSPLFKLFAVMDVVSLACSLTSVVMFLSILTSPFQKQNFLYSLPRKLTIGFLFLFLSVLTTMVTFTASVLLTVRLGGNWTNSVFYAAAFIPVTIFALIMFPWYAPFVGIFIRFTKPIAKVLPARAKKSM